MRKFYTLAFAGLLSVTALAAPGQIDRSLARHVKNSASPKLNLRALYEAGLTNDIVKRSWTDPTTNLTWNAYFGKTGEWCKEFDCSEDIPEYGLKKGDPFPFFLMPFYKIQSEFYTDDRQNVIVSLMWWPAEAFFQPESTPKDELNNNPLSMNDSRITSLNFEQGNPYEYFYLGPDNNPSAWLIQSATEFDVPSLMNGVSMYTTVGNTLRINSYDNSTSDLTCRYKGRLNPKQGGSQQRTVDLNYNGKSIVLGWETYNYKFNIADVLVYNTGLWGAGPDAEAAGVEESQLYAPDWGPLRRYYVAFCEEGLSYPKFDKDNMVFTPSKDGPVDKCFGYGAAYAPANATEPYGLYTMYDLGSKGANAYAPQEYGLIAGGYNYDFSDEDGFAIVTDRMFRWQADGSKLGIGDKNDGFFYEGKDEYGNGFNFIYTGKIKFFNDPSDYSKYVEIDACKDLSISAVEQISADDTASVKIGVKGGQIVVIADKDTPVAVYTIAGQIVANSIAKAGETFAVDAANGIYVVKAGDKAVKVIL